MTIIMIYFMGHATSCAGYDLNKKQPQPIH